LRVNPDLAANFLTILVSPSEAWKLIAISPLQRRITKRYNLYMKPADSEEYVGAGSTNSTRPITTPTLIVVLSLIIIAGSVFPITFGFVRILCFFAFNVVLVYAISLAAASRLPLHSRMGIGYLLATGLAYFWAGFFGLRDSGQIVTFLIFRNSLVFPLAALTHAIQTCVSTHPCQSQDLGYVWPESIRHLSEIVMAFALVAIGAAVAMFRRIRVGYIVWLVFVLIAVTASVWNILGDFIVARGGGTEFDFSSVDYVYPVFWTASYVLAYWFARLEPRVHA
jgi:hypothetical protein